MFQLRREIDILQIPQKKFYDIDHCPNYNRKALGITLTEIYSRVNQVEIRSRRRTEILRMAIETVQRLQRPFKGHFKAIETIQRPQRPLKGHRDRSKALETLQRLLKDHRDLSIFFVSLAHDIQTVFCPTVSSLQNATKLGCYATVHKTIQSTKRATLLLNYCL